LRNERSLVQTTGRAARNINGMVIMYADKMTNSMQRTIDETARRRALQTKYNDDNGTVPIALNKSKQKILDSTQVADGDTSQKETDYSYDQEMALAADPVVQYMTPEQLDKTITFTRKQMEKAAKDLDFIEAARLRDELYALEMRKKNGA
jgi:excinuclease ABC subunit B